MIFRTTLAIILPVLLIGASWPNNWGQVGEKYLRSNGRPLVYAPLLASFTSDTPAVRTNVWQLALAATDKFKNTASVPLIEKIKVGRRKGYSVVEVELSRRADFWYWTALDGRELAISFPLVRAISNGSIEATGNDLISAIVFEKSDEGGRIVVKLSKPGLVRNVRLMRPTARRGFRIFVDVAELKDETPFSNGHGMAWGGGDLLDNVNLILAQKAKQSDQAATKIANAPIVAEAPKLAKAEAPKSTKAEAVQATPEPTASQEEVAEVKDEVKSRRQFADLGWALAGLGKTHNRILAARADLAAARENMALAQGAWFPEFSLTAHYGFEEQRKGQGVNDTRMPSREVDLKVTQLLWDFGATVESPQLRH